MKSLFLGCMFDLLSPVDILRYSPIKTKILLQDTPAISITLALIGWELLKDQNRYIFSKLFR